MYRKHLSATVASTKSIGEMKQKAEEDKDKHTKEKEAKIVLFKAKAAENEARDEESPKRQKLIADNELEKTEVMKSMNANIVSMFGVLASPPAAAADTVALTNTITIMRADFTEKIEKLQENGAKVE